MGGNNVVKAMLKARNVDHREWAEMAGLTYGSFRTKLSRNTFSFRYVEEVAEALDFEIVVVDKRTGKPLGYTAEVTFRKED